MPSESEQAGRWAGDRLVLVGDYDGSRLFERAEREFREISGEIMDDYNRFIGDEELKLGKSRIGRRP